MDQTIYMLKVLITHQFEKEMRKNNNGKVDVKKGESKYEQHEQLVLSTYNISWVDYSSFSSIDISFALLYLE